MKSKPSGFDWTPFDAVMDEELKATKPVPPARAIRQMLKISQHEFARRFQIPIGTLRDWEQGRKEPEAAGRAYLKVIGRNPLAVAEALSTESTS